MGDRALWKQQVTSGAADRNGGTAWHSCARLPSSPLGIEDHAAFDGSKDDQRSLLHRAYVELERRIELFVNLDLESLDSMGLQSRLDDIGKINGRGWGPVARENDWHGNSEALPRNQMNNESPGLSVA